MSEPFLGQIMMFAGNFAPRGWAFCDGQLLAVAQNDALFSLLGTTYGGDGRTTFGLPDLRGRAPIHMGEGPGLTDRPIGAKLGAEHASITASQLPPHTHTLMASTDAGDETAPAGRVLAKPEANAYAAAAAGTATHSAALGSTGSGQPHPNMMPFQCLNFCIALVGIFPSRH